MISARRLAARLLAKVTFCWLSSNIQRRCISDQAVRCAPQASSFLRRQSLRQLSQLLDWSQLAIPCNIRSYKPPCLHYQNSVHATGCHEAMSNVHAGGASMQGIRNSMLMRMISSQGAPCFSHCKVKLNEKIQRLYCSSSGLHAIPTQAQLAGRATRFCTDAAARICSADHRYISLDCMCLSQNIPQEPSRVHSLSVMPMCTRLHLSSHHLCHGHSLLSKQQPWSTVCRQLVTVRTKSASAGKVDAVQAEFAKAGISAEVAQNILKKYKAFLNWDVETKLRPALQSWLQELGTEQLSQQLQKLPRLLMCMPEEHNKVCSWLVSKGLNAAWVQQKAPQVMTREIRAVQSTFEALQQAAAFSDAPMCTLLHTHSVAFEHGPEHVAGTLQVVSALVDTPMTSDSFREVLLAASNRVLCSPGVQSPFSSM